MLSAKEFAGHNGWPSLFWRAGSATTRRLRDRLTGKRLGAPGFHVGRGPRLLGLSHMQIGEDFHAGDALWLEAVVQYAGRQFAPTLRIGPHARLSDSVHIGCLAEIVIGAHFLCGSRVLISDHTHGRYDGSVEASDPLQPPADRQLYSRGAVRIGSNVWLGDGVAVLAGASIGDGVIIGANAVVNGPIPSETIAVGAPAQPIRKWDRVARAWLPLT